MAFDGIVTKAICSELSDLVGARIEKIFEPNKNTVTIKMYSNGKNLLLNICIDAQNCRINLTTHPSPNPQVAPNFCMVLRKNLIGLRLKNISTLDLERLVIMEFGDFNNTVSRKLIIELMGKHSNIILLDDEQIIIDSLRHIKSDNEEFREILPHIKYTFPKTEKSNLLEIQSFENFYTKIQDFMTIHEGNENIPVSTLICSVFNGISKIYIENIIQKLQEKGELIFQTCNTKELQSDSMKKFLEIIYKEITNLISLIDTSSLSFEIIQKSDTKNKKDYVLTSLSSSQDEPYPLNFFIDDFYYEKETADNFKNERNNLLKYILNILYKYNKRLHNIQDKLKECENMEIYQLYGELITSNLYQFDGNQKLKEITVMNYYNNTEITIPLDNRYTLNINAKRYFKKYKKLKNALEIVTKQKEETNLELDYLQSIVYELENSSTIEEVYEIFDEISENTIFQNSRSSKNSANTNSLKKIKKSNLTKNKNVSFNPIKYNVEGYTVLVGRNNKENDYLTLKYAHKFDIWFHVKDFHGSHTILCLPNEDAINHIPDTLLVNVAKLAISHSKARNSSNVPVDYCQVRYVKKPRGSKPGMVIYTDYKTIYV